MSLLPEKSSGGRGAEAEEETQEEAGPDQHIFKVTSQLQLYTLTGLVTSLCSDIPTQPVLVSKKIEMISTICVYKKI